MFLNIKILINIVKGGVSLLPWVKPSPTTFSLKIIFEFHHNLWWIVFQWEKDVLVHRSHVVCTQRAQQFIPSTIIHKLMVSIDLSLSSAAFSASSSFCSAVPSLSWARSSSSSTSWILRFRPATSPSACWQRKGQRLLIYNYIPTFNAAIIYIYYIKYCPCVFCFFFRSVGILPMMVCNFQQFLHKAQSTAKEKTFLDPLRPPLPPVVIQTKIGLRMSTMVPLWHFSVLKKPHSQTTHLLHW